MVRRTSKRHSMEKQGMDNTNSWRLIVVGGRAPDLDATELVCDILKSFPNVHWIAGKITHPDGGASPQNSEVCGSSPTEPICVLDWETHAATGIDSARFLAAGAMRSFSLRAKPGSLAVCLPMLRQALNETSLEAALHDSQKIAIIVESNTLAQLLKPSLYFVVIDLDKLKFTDPAVEELERANALVLRGSTAEIDGPPSSLWLKMPAKLLQQRPSVLHRPGEPLPRPLQSLVYQMLDDAPAVCI